MFRILEVGGKYLQEFLREDGVPSITDEVVVNSKSKILQVTIMSRLKRLIMLWWELNHECFQYLREEVLQRSFAFS